MQKMCMRLGQGERRGTSGRNSPPGYFNPYEAHNSNLTGEIVLAGNADLYETIPHEVFHAVLWRFGALYSEDDEGQALMLGKLCSAIHKRIREEVEVAK